MANLSDTTRKGQILRFLQERPDEWVDGNLLATEAVGGSEGLRRLRDLRSDGYLIQQRRHPDPNRDIWQYRLLTKSPEITPLRGNAPTNVQQPTPPQKKRLVFGESMFCTYCDGKGRKTGAECPICKGQGWV